MSGYVGHNTPVRNISKSLEQQSDWVPIKHIDCNGALLSTVEFKDGSDDVVIDDTFYEYLFMFDGVQPHSTGDRSWAWQVNAAGETGFNESFTQNGMTGPSMGDLSGSQGSWTGTNAAGFSNSNGPQHNATDYTLMMYNSVGSQTHTTATGNATAGDKSHVSGELRLYHPSDATYYTPYTSIVTSEYDDTNGYGRYLYQSNYSGMITVAAAIDEVSFKFTAGTVNGGTISLYGLTY